MHVFSLRRSTLQPRLFQQACRHASASTRRLLNRRRLAPPQSKQPANYRPEDEQDDEIRWFEQDVETGNTRRVERNPEEMEADELRQKIAALEKELNEYHDEESDEDLLAALEPEDRAKVEVALRERKQTELQTTSGLNVSLEMPPLTVPLLKKFNAALREAALHPTMITRRKDLWRWYGRARYSIPALPSMIPDKAWRVLWDTQSIDLPTNPDRLTHMELLLLDMSSVNMEIMPNQDCVYIETLLALNKTHQALAHWQEVYESSSAVSEPLLALGVKLFSENRHLDKADEILIHLFKTFPNHDPRIILPLLSANLSAGNEQLAFGYYVFLNQKLGEAMTMDDYDFIYLNFLEHSKKELALAVFRDMMLRGPNKQLSERFLDANQRNELYNAFQKRMETTELSKDIDAHFVNRVSLYTLSALPAEWQNKFFYGSWLKKLIGMNQIEAATKVVELMYERGVEPDAKHMNGIVDGFFRSKSRELHEKGEQMAWSMIQQRLDFQYRLRRAARGEEPLPEKCTDITDEGVKIPAHMTRPVPRATIETFNVLALHYTERKRWAYIHLLDRMRRPAKFSQDSTFFNHMLHMWHLTKDEMHMWGYFLKKAQYTDSLDLETYHILWKGQLENINPVVSKAKKGYPPPRQLFALMISWIDKFDAKKIEKIAQGFTDEMYFKIISSFSANKDLAGCLVALHGIAKIFGKFPDPDIARVVLTGACNFPETQPVMVRGRRGRQQLPSSELRLRNMTKVMGALANQRAEEALKQGIVVTEMDNEARKQESLNLLSQFIRMVLVRVSDRDVDAVEAGIVEAAEAMGLKDISTGDKDASNVVDLL